MGFQHHRTLKKAKLQGAYQYALFQKRHYGTPFYNNDLFLDNGISKTRGYEILKDYKRTFHNNPFVNESRGWKKILSKEDINKMEKIIWDYGIKGWMLSYQGLLIEAGVNKEVITRTI